MQISLATFCTVTAFGVIGYRLLGLSLFDALYQTAITVTTVGFGEIGPTARIDRGYRVFTLLLVVFGVGAVLYTLGVFVESLMAGTFNDSLRLRRTQRMIDQVSDHVILVGAGRVGQAILRYIGHHDVTCVVIDQLSKPQSDHLQITGEATDDETLRRAGVDRARTLITALDSDPDNLYVTLSAKALNPDLFIVARTRSRANTAKFHQAGADRVVSPYEIGGARMGALALHPTLADFMDEALHGETQGMQIVEIAVSDGSPVLNRRLGDTFATSTHHALTLAIRTDNVYVVAPNPDTRVNPGDVLVVLGDQKSIDAMRVVVAG